MDDAFLTTDEVLDYLQVNLRTVYRLIKAGKLPAVRVGRQWRFRRRDIDAWLQRQQASASGRAVVAQTAGPAPAAGLPSPLSPAIGEETGQEVAARRILVADDEESIRELLSKALSLADYEVDSAPDGRAALERLRSRTYDLLITDLRMPCLDGLGLIREVKRLWPAIPIVIITGYSTEGAAIEALNLGVKGYLTKPFRVSKILAAAARALGE